MKSFAAAALIGATSAEPSFINFITDMAIQEAEAAQRYQEEEPKFAFQELLVQMHIDEIKAWEAQKEEMTFTDAIAMKIREEREKPSMMDAFTAMSLERRENEQNEESLLDAFTAMTLKRRESRGEEKSFMDLITNIAREEREQPSMMDAFTAMTLERRVAETEEKKPGFLDFMIGMAQAEAKPKSFMDATTKMIIKQREQPSMMDAFSAMTLEKRLAEAEPVKLFEKGLPHAMAMMAVKEYEAKQVVDTKELTFLNDVLHPEHVYEPFSFTAVKAAHKYFTN